MDLIQSPHNDPADARSCHGCKNLRFAAPEPKDHAEIPCVPAVGFGAPGKYQCWLYGTLCSASRKPTPVKTTCKETY